ncbi:13401_t:CDS:2 [Gigaspora margarita]|uniref:13401_t:CDS:1 n=1 Tax=Gigaspora margarita TaxID=4874 RepID=A0ABN7UGG3_GIGMA|nr:13401_t:CDS:2 [Gigaspora margarita]
MSAKNLSSKKKRTLSTALDLIKNLGNKEDEESSYDIIGSKKLKYEDGWVFTNKNGPRLEPYKEHDSDTLSNKKYAKSIEEEPWLGPEKNVLLNKKYRVESPNFSI